MFTLLVALIVCASALICQILNLHAIRPAMVRRGTESVTPHFGAVSVLLTPLAGFTANDAWERQRQASRVVQTERANAAAVHDLILGPADNLEIRRRLPPISTPSRRRNGC